ncbi:MAG: hypothetical protein FWD32_00840 [Firmicutes bacterium]|nr:hypothetical protein [Bacillota bacterium]
MENQKELNLKSKQIYFGTGLASMKAQSIGLGLGTLGMILTAAKEGKKNNTTQILHEIGIGYNLTEEERIRLVDEQMKIYNKLTDGLYRLKMIDGNKISLKHKVWTPEYLASQDFTKALAQTENILQSSFANIANYATLKKYTAIQTAGVRLAIENGAVCKIGWTPNGSVKDLQKQSIQSLIENNRINEYYFDAVLKHCYPNLEWATQYIAGDVDWETGHRKSPYTVTEKETRPLLDKPILKYYQNNKHLNRSKEAIDDLNKKVVTPFEELFGDLNCKNNNATEQTIEKLATIQNQILGI